MDFFKNNNGITPTEETNYKSKVSTLTVKLKGHFAQLFKDSKRKRQLQQLEINLCERIFFSNQKPLSFNEYYISSIHLKTLLEFKDLKQLQSYYEYLVRYETTDVLNKQKKDLDKVLIATEAIANYYDFVKQDFEALSIEANKDFAQFFIEGLEQLLNIELKSGVLTEQFTESQRIQKPLEKLNTGFKALLSLIDFLVPNSITTDIDYLEKNISKGLKLKEKASTFPIFSTLEMLHLEGKDVKPLIIRIRKNLDYSIERWEQYYNEETFEKAQHNRFLYDSVELKCLISHTNGLIKNVVSEIRNFEALYLNEATQEKTTDGVTEPPMDAIITEKSKRLIEKLKPYKLPEYLEQSKYQPEAIYQMISDHSGKELLPYTIALLHVLGYLKYFFNEFMKTKQEGLKQLAVIFDASERRIKGNVNILNPQSKENGTQYTSHQYIENIEKELKGR